jgi:hypothetical protein
MVDQLISNNTNLIVNNQLECKCMTNKLQNLILKLNEFDIIVDKVIKKIEDEKKSKLISNKKNLGQFYTTNYKYILSNMYIPDNITHIIEPFAGRCDLLKFIDEKKYDVSCYDIDPKIDTYKSLINTGTSTLNNFSNEEVIYTDKSHTCELSYNVVKRDTLNNPPKYLNKFVLTNPPYLARNKTNQKDIFNKYNQNDLYKCFISELTTNKCVGGIIIIPLNFWCSIRLQDVMLRKKFIETYDILLINIFEERVFIDTAYAICSFQFTKKNSVGDKTIKCGVYSDNKLQKQFDVILNNKNNFTVGGHLYNLKKHKKINVDRLTKKNINSEFKTNILLKCIDDSITSKINLSIVDDQKVFIDNTPKLSARSYATLVIEPRLNRDQSEMLVNAFNLYINVQRKKYNSLFLTNYRESNTIARKRISFKLAFDIVNYILHSQIFTSIDG